jgi:hypothetical protein
MSCSNSNACFSLHLLRGLVLVFAVLGCSVFGLAFLLSVLSPGVVEQTAKAMIRYQVEQEVHEKVSALDRRFLVNKAEVFSSKLGVHRLQIQALIEAQLPARLASTIAEMQNLDCECRRNVESSVQLSLDGLMKSELAMQERLTVLIRSKYMEVSAHLLREFRIFSGVNAVVFALLMLVVLMKRQADVHLIPVALVLLAAIVATVYLYLFKQNWLHSMVFDEYVGLAYAAYLMGVFALLADIFLNRARLTAEMLNVECCFDTFGASGGGFAMLRQPSVLMRG